MGECWVILSRATIAFRHIFVLSMSASRCFWKYSFNGQRIQILNTKLCFRTVFHKHFFAASNHTIPKYGQKHIDFIDGIIKRDRQKHMPLWTLQMKPDEPPEIQGPGRLGFLHQNDICLKKLWSHYSWRFFLSWPGWRHRRGGRWRRRWCRRGSTWQGLSTLLSLRGSLQGLSWTGSPTPGSGIRWMRF